MSPHARASLLRRAFFSLIRGEGGRASREVGDLVTVLGAPITLTTPHISSSTPKERQPSCCHT